MASARVRVFDGPLELGQVLADEILDAYERAPGREFLLGCPAGRSLLTTYEALAASRADLDRLVVVMMDEYLLDGVLVSKHEHFSCRRFGEEHLASPLGLDVSRLWFPEPEAPEAYDARIAAAGGIDMFLLACGTSDGHVAFLGPGAPMEGRTSVVALADGTRRDNVATFPAFESPTDVPTHGVSVGLGTIRAARVQRLVAHGPGKRAVVQRLLSLDRFDAQLPASIVHACVDAEILIDRAASGRAGGP